MPYHRLQNDFSSLPSTIQLLLAPATANMKSPNSALLFSLALCRSAAGRAVGGSRRAATSNASVVSGEPMGFASAVTGGGDAAPVYPTTIDELKDYLTSEDPQVIVISGTYDFAGSEGTSDFDACNSYDCTPEDGGQALLNTLDGCGSTPTYSVSLDTAAYQGIQVASDKTLVGKDKATLKGKGLRFVDASNIIVQNIEITDLNPKYVWGGDALTFSGTKNVWIDHVTVSCFILILRMVLHRLRRTSHQGANTALRVYRLRTRAGSTIPLDRTPAVALPSRIAFLMARRPNPLRATATPTGRWSLSVPTTRSHFTVSGSFS